MIGPALCLIFSLQGMVDKKMKTVISVLAVILILVGLISMVTPIPGGAILISGGLTMLICASPSAQYCIMWIRAKVNWINKLVAWLEKTIGPRVKVVGVALGKTQPPEDGVILSHRDLLRNNINQQT